MKAQTMSRSLISVEDVFADVNLPTPLTIWYGSEEIHDFEKYAQEVAEAHFKKLSARDKKRVSIDCYFVIWKSYLALQPLIRALYRLNSTARSSELKIIYRHKKELIMLHQTFYQFLYEEKNNRLMLGNLNLYNLARQLYSRDSKNDLRKKRNDWKRLLAQTWRRSSYIEPTDHTLCYNCSKIIMGYDFYMRLQKQKRIKKGRDIRIAYTNGTLWLCSSCIMHLREHYLNGKRTKIKTLPVDYYEIRKKRL